ncbi:MAG: hypothetical protein N2V72_00085 [Methanophagales archaeon]|nr:hypothetical protein [Methanophagales archaeon]
MIFDWLLDDPLFDLFLGEVPEEVKKARENLRKAREELYEARRKAVEEQLEKGENALALPGIAISFGGSEEEFQASVERLARAHPDAKVEAKNVQFPNGWYRSVRIEKKG